MKNGGFTLTELVATIILIGIMAVSVIPRIFDRSDAAPSVQQSRLISILRNIQIRALSDTREFVGEEYPCFRVNFDNINNAFGPPALTYYDSDNPSDTSILEATCDSAIDTTTNSDLFYVTSAELSADSIDLEATNSQGDSISYIKFASDGLPFLDSGDGDCSIGCTIQLCDTDCSDLSKIRVLVCIEPQGYIHGGTCGV